jgi:hypothetical protein
MTLFDDSLAIALLTSASLLLGSTALAQKAPPAPNYPDSIKAHVGAA